MSIRIKKTIQKTLKAPMPDEQIKARFLRTLPKPQISMWQFILRQASFLRKRTLFLSFLLLIPAFVGFRHLNPDTIWFISAFIPFLALLAVTESTRSEVYGMCEFEMSTRFSVKNVILARLSMWGIIDLTILCCTIPLCYANGQIPLLQTGIYLFVPYLLTANISLWLTRHIRSRESIILCMAVAVLISGLSVGLHLKFGFVYQPPFFHWWLLLTIILIGEMVYEVCHTIKETEEYKWNLSSTD